MLELIIGNIDFKFEGLIVCSKTPTEENIVRILMAEEKRRMNIYNLLPLV